MVLEYLHVLDLFISRCISAIDKSRARTEKLNKKTTQFTWVEQWIYIQRIYSTDRGQYPRSNACRPCAHMYLDVIIRKI